MPENTADAQRYTRTAIWMHWLIGLAILAQIVFGFLLDEIAPRNTPARTGVINLHKSFGMSLGVLIALRLLWRVWHRPPVWPKAMTATERLAAAIVHRTLYACMVLMPTSGYVASNFSKYGVKYFGFALEPWGPELPQVYAFFNSVHIATAYVFSALILGHVLAALKHALVDRDRIFSRMLP